MKKAVIILLALLIEAGGDRAWSQFKLASGSAGHIKIPDLIITGEKKGEFSARDNEVYTYNDFARQQPLTIESLLEPVPAVYIQSRGAKGAQQDVGMLEAGYEQTLIMLDGIPLNDPQTGHFNMNLPVFPAAVERMHILTGSGSIRYGSGAMGGAVNIVPGYNKDVDHLSFYYGSYSSFGAEYIHRESAGNFENFTALSLRRSGNFHQQTDLNRFSILNVSKFGSGRILTGYIDKENGAYDFYTPGWDMPSRDFNRSGIVSVFLSSEGDKLSFSPSFTWRRHFNRFILKAHNEEFYENEHVNDVLNTSLEVEYSGLRGGVDLRRDTLNSSNMGSRDRNIFSPYAEYTYFPLRTLLLYAGLRYEEETLPRLSAAWQVFNGLKARTSWGKAYRRPSFTELYYEDPANTGNENLKNEKSESVEFGFDFDFTSGFKSSITIFEKKYYDIIDWVGESESGPWRVENRGGHISKSLLFRSRYCTSVADLNFGYSYTDIKTQDDYFSKYFLKYLRHRVKLSAAMKIAGFQLNISGQYGIPVNRPEQEFQKVHLVLGRKISFGRLFLKVENVTGSSFSFIEGVPAPGRWFTAGMSW